MDDDRTGAEYASGLARRYLSLLAADLFAEADALRRALPFHTWPEPWRSDSYTRFLIDVGEPGEALAEARACAAASGWDEWSSLQLVWAQLACHLDKEALETLNEVEVSPLQAAWADNLRFRLHMSAREFECAAAFLSDRGLGLDRHELHLRRRVWMYLVTPGRPVEPPDALFELDRAHPPLPNGLVIPNDLDASLDPGVTALEFTARISKKVLSKDFRSAEAEAVVLTRIAPRYPLGWSVLGEVRFYLGKLDSAGDAFEEALRICPSYAHARLSRAHVRYREARFREAAQDAETVVMQQPLDIRAAGYSFAVTSEAYNCERLGKRSAVSALPLDTPCASVNWSTIIGDWNRPNCATTRNGWGFSDPLGRPSRKTFSSGQSTDWTAQYLREMIPNWPGLTLAELRAREVFARMKGMTLMPGLGKRQFDTPEALRFDLVREWQDSTGKGGGH